MPQTQSHTQPDGPRTALSRRRVLGATAALASATALAACNRPGSSGAGSTETIAMLTLWHRLPDAATAALEAMVEEWNKANPDVQMTALHFDGTADELEKQVADAVAKGKVPDLVQVEAEDLPAWYGAGDLSDVTKAAASYTGSYTKGSLAQTTVDGVLCGIPLTVDPLVYAYDAAAFTEQGWSAPASWAELSSEGWAGGPAGKYVVTWDPERSAHRMAALTTADGGAWFTADGGTWTAAVDGEASQTVGAAVQKVLTDQIDVLATGDSAAQVVQASITSGTLLGAVVRGSEVASLLPDGAEAWTLTAAPTVSGSGTAVLEGGSSLCVPKGCEQTADALRAAHFLAGHVQELSDAGLVAASTTATPTTGDALAKAWGGQDVAGFLATTAKDAAGVTYAPAWDAVVDALSGVGSNPTPAADEVATALAAAQQAAQRG